MLCCEAAPESKKEAQNARKKATGALGVANNWPARAGGGGVGGEVPPFRGWGLTKL